MNPGSVPRTTSASLLVVRYPDPYIAPVLAQADGQNPDQLRVVIGVMAIADKDARPGHGVFLSYFRFGFRKIRFRIVTAPLKLPDCGARLLSQ